MNNVFYKETRQKLLDKIEDGSLLVLFSGWAPHRSADAYHRFEVHPTFRYFTGLTRENLVLLLIKKGDKTEEILYIDPVDEYYAKWIGRQMKKEEATSVSGIENVKENTSFEKELARHINTYGITNIYFDLYRHGFDDAPSREMLFAQQIGEKFMGINILSCDKIVGAMRRVKSKEEVEQIEKAIKITDDGINAMMKNSRPQMMEYEYEALFNYELKRQNADPSFGTILASGDSGYILHYVENNRAVEDGQLMLCDLGAKVDGYCADITRTFPINGKYSKRQAQLYDIVLEANKRAIAAAKPGVTQLDINKVVVEYYAQKLKEIGLISEPSEVSKYYYHGCCHSLGLDVHDVGNGALPLVPGNVITIEPGLYIAEEGIGIRIEDDVLITETGCDVLSKGIIKEIADIEAFMAN